MTPRLLVLEFDARKGVLAREHNERAWMVWHVVALDRTKKLPKIEKLYARDRSPRRPAARQTPAQMFAIAKMLTAAYGGRVIKKTEH